jgi:hypothetical protein
MKARRQRELEKCNRIYTMVKKLELILCRVLGKTILHATYLLGRFVSFSCLVGVLDRLPEAQDIGEVSRTIRVK